MYFKMAEFEDVRIVTCEEEDEIENCIDFDIHSINLN